MLINFLHIFMNLIWMHWQYKFFLHCACSACADSACADLDNYYNSTNFDSDSDFANSISVSSDSVCFDFVASDFVVSNSISLDSVSSFSVVLDSTFLGSVCSGSVSTNSIALDSTFFDSVFSVTSMIFTHSINSTTSVDSADFLDPIGYNDVVVHEFSESASAGAKATTYFGGLAYAPTGSPPTPFLGQYEFAYLENDA